jgi:hypothetical protein
MAQDVVFMPPKEIKPPNQRLHVSFMVGTGLISPDDVNQYIQNYISAKTAGGYYISYGGSSDILLEGVFNFSLVVPVGLKMQLKFPMEYGIGSKHVIIDDENEYFTLNRFAPGVIADYYFQSEKRNAFFFGAGFLYNFMWFEGYHANCISPRLELGYRWRKASAGWELLIMADQAEGHISNQTYYNSVKTIDFSGVLLAIRFIPGLM